LQLVLKDGHLLWHQKPGHSVGPLLISVKLHLRDRDTRPFVRCVCQGRPSYKGNESRCFIDI